MVRICENNIIREYADTKHIYLNCMNCLESIADFSFVQHFSRLSWCISCSNLMNDITFDVSMWGEIFCDCDKFLGFELTLDEWVLFKHNLVLQY